jgi:16S rRNA G966 N2-methylase RsmD
MRIISGSHKGRTIVPPRNFRARPTTDFAKESLFNVLNNITTIENAEVLDLIASTGSISFEFA